FGEAWVPVSDIQKMQTYSDASRWTGGVNLNYAWRADFTHRFSIGLDQVEEQKSRFFPFEGNYGPAGVTNGSRNLGFRKYSSLTMDYLGQYNFKLPFGVGSDFSFGGQVLKEDERFNVAVGNTFAGPGVSTVSAGAVTTGGEAFSQKTNVGGLLQNRFSWKDQLFTTVGIRMDGNSAFGENYGFKRYPKIDAAWVVTQN